MHVKGMIINMMNVNKIMRIGSFFFAIFLFVFSVLKYNSGQTKTGAYYFIAALGFFVVYLSYLKKGKGSK
jgi:hypothetical protein